MQFKNPQNNYTVKTESEWAYTLVFGCFFFLKHNAYGHAVIAFVLALFTVGISWLIYPFFGKKIIRETYLKKGWIEVS